MKTYVDEYFRVLELPDDATPEEIRIRYRQMIRVYHPDRYQDPLDKEFVEHMMKRVNEAYNVLVQLPKAETSIILAPKTVFPVQAPPMSAPVRAVVTGVPALFAFILIGVSFILGTIFARVFDFAPIATTSAIRPAVERVAKVGTTSTLANTPTRDAAIDLPVPAVDPLVLAADPSLDASPESSSAENVSAATATPLPTATELSIATNTAEPTSTEPPTATAIPPTATVIVQPTNTAPPAASIQPANSAQAVSPGTSFVNTGNGILLTVPGQYNVFVRGTTSIQGEPVALVAAGEQILIVGRTIDNYWLRITLSDGRQGWLYAETVGASAGLLTQLPVVDPY